MATRSLRQMQCLRPRELTLSGVVTITAAGAISTQGQMDASGVVANGAKNTGGTVSKTAAKSGRYGVAFDRKYRHVKFVGATMIGPDDAAFPTTTGSSPKCRLLADTSGFSIQFVREDTQADADPASGTKFTWMAIVSLS